MIGRVIGIEKLSHKKCVVSTDVRADVNGMPSTALCGCFMNSDVVRILRGYVSCCSLGESDNSHGKCGPQEDT